MVPRRNIHDDIWASKKGILFSLVIFTAGCMLYLYMGFAWGTKAFMANIFFAALAFVHLFKAIAQSIRLYETDKGLMKGAAALNPLRTVPGTVISIISAVVGLCIFLPITVQHIEKGATNMSWLCAAFIALFAWSLYSAMRDVMRYWRRKIQYPEPGW